MASNFQISSNRAGDSLHLELSGDFDGTSAHELLHFIKKYSNEISMVYIHTGSLQQIHAFGRDILHRRLGIVNSNFGKIIFKGDKAAHLSLK
jgi:hypothetical protein